MKLNTIFLRTLLALAMAAGPAFPAAAGTRDTATATDRADLANVRIENFGRINDNYFRGAQPSSRDYAALAALGVKTIIDLQRDDYDPNEGKLAEAAGMKFYRIPMTTHKPPTNEQLAQFLSIVNDPVQQPVYVHCKGGRHRTGVMTAAYRMTADGWTAEQAFREMKQYQFGADFLHPEFKEYVYRFDTSRAATATGVTAVRAGGQ